MLKHETSGPKLFVHGENTINAFHDQLLLNGLDQSVTPSDSPLLKQKIVEFKNLCFKSEKGLTTENLSRSEKNNPSEFKTPKDVSLFKELRRLKLVKIAINKLNNLNTSGFVQRLRKINYQIIGDNAQDFNETSSLQVLLKKKNSYFIIIEIFSFAIFNKLLEKNPHIGPKQQI